MADEDFFEEEELVAATPNQRNWRGIILALLVIAFIFSMIVVSVILLTKPDNRAKVTGSRFTLEDIVRGDFKVAPFNGSWLSDRELVFMDNSGGLSVLDCQSLTLRSLMNNVTFRQENVRHFWVSPDQQYVLLAHDVRQKFRHSYSAHYTVYDVARRFRKALTPTPDDRGHPLLSYAAWVPTENVTGGRGNAIVMVYNNDIYYKETAAAELVDRLTFSGSPGVLFNGVPDWLYEEEILSSNVAMWFNKKGDRMVYASFNDTNVQATPLTYYQQGPEAPNKYPAVFWIRYPQTGTANPDASLWVIALEDLQNPKPKYLKPPSELKKSDHYFTGVSWVNDDTVSVVWVNRHQNTSHISHCASGLWYCFESHVQEQRRPGWLEVQAAPLYAADGSSYLTLLPVRDAAAGYYRHVNHFDLTSRRMTAVTIGTFEVLQLLGWHERQRQIYFVAVPPAVPGERHLYRVNHSLGRAQSVPECLTCADNTTQRPCTFARVSMAPGMKYYILECLGPSVPWVELYMLPENKPLTVLNDYPEVRERADNMAWPQVRNLELPLSSGVVAAVQLVLPPGLRDDDITTYPLIVEVYGGPGTQQVTSRWRVGWHTYMASGRNFIYARIDGSGSGNRGHRLKHRVHGKLGTLEVEDQLAAIRRLREEQYFIDGRRIIIWGWSYGGFAAASALAQDSQHLLRGAISVAPVTDWSLYDSAYTERFMGVPGRGGNHRGYDDSDLTRQAALFKDKNLFLVHGTADDNVHVQHSMVLSRALVRAGVSFRQQIYPDENHFLAGVKEHMYSLMEDFIEQCFLPPKKIIDEALAKLRKKKKIT